MHSTSVELYKYIHIADGYGGSKIVPTLVRKLKGKLIPNTHTKQIDGAMESFKVESRFICDTKVDPAEGQLIKVNDRLYSITQIIDVYSKGSVLGLMQIG